MCLKVWLIWVLMWLWFRVVMVLLWLRLLLVMSMNFVSLVFVFWIVWRLLGCKCILWILVGFVEVRVC